MTRQVSALECADLSALWLASRFRIGMRGNACLTLFFIQQIKNIGAYFGRIGVPTIFPVAVEFPHNSRTSMSLVGAPRAERRMRLGKASVRAQVDGGRHPAGGQLRAMNTIIAGKRLR